MDIETIIAGIKHAGQKQMEQIARDVDLQISEIKDASQENASLQKQRIMALSQGQLQREQALIMQQAMMECLQIHANGRQLLIENTLNTVKTHFSKIRQNKNYPKIFEAMVEEAISALRPSLNEGQSTILHIDQRDKSLFNNFANFKSPPLSLVCDLECWGGCNAETEDGLVQVLNTINSRFDHALPLLQMQLSLYFEERTQPN